MSTPPSAYGDPETRRRILDAAWALLEERGSGVRVADIADRAGVSRQAVYLHFGDRVTLVTAVADHIDVTFGRDRLRQHVFGAPTGRESLRRWVETMSWYTAKIDSVTRVLELAAESDEALAAAWRDRMTGRRGHVQRIVGRLASEAQLAEGWTVEAATDLVYSVTLPGPWRVLTSVLGWSTERYAADITSMLERALLATGGGEAMAAAGT
ncbi:MAG: TetR/AcrR family transcriptional regulator [Candidatus Limnocylindria bacterium]